MSDEADLRHGCDPLIGHRFPAAEVLTLAGETLHHPDALAGAPSVLLVAYRRSSQPDVDLWRQELVDELPALRVLEVPTIPSPVWRPVSSWIDAGMRGGVPQELWSRVATAYDDGDVIRRFVGDAGRPVAHVVLLGGDGVAHWFAADGFSRERAAELVDAVSRLTS